MRICDISLRIREILPLQNHQKLHIFVTKWTFKLKLRLNMVARGSHPGPHHTWKLMMLPRPSVSWGGRHLSPFPSLFDPLSFW